MEATPLILKPRGRGLGDIVCLTALVRDIALTYPGRYDVHVMSSFRGTWDRNPHGRAFSRDNFKGRKVPAEISLSYMDGNKESRGGRRIHMVGWYHVALERAAGIQVPLTLPHGDLHLTESELARTPVSGRYWVMLAGGKTDITNKLWPTEYWQEVANTLRADGIQVVQAGTRHASHIHRPLEGVVDMIGRTANEREFFALIANSAGVICPVTAAMHIAAVFAKPCVVISGGREEPWWEHYTDEHGSFGGNWPDCRPVAVPHTFLHTLGQLPCCQDAGCWRRLTVAQRPGDHSNRRTQQTICLRPDVRDSGPVAECMSMITPDQVVEAVRNFERGRDPQETPRPRVAARAQVPDLLPLTATARATVAETPEIPKTSLESPLPATPPVQSFRVPDDQYQVMDHPILGGRLTVFVLCYGDYPELAEKCLGGILRTVPRHRLDLRVIGNAVSGRTAEVIHSHGPDVTYLCKENRYKYPAMREAFRDPARPIQTNYLAWFDDDTYPVDPLWAVRLAAAIISGHPQGHRLFGWRMLHDFRQYQRGGHRPDMWFRRASWWQGRHFRVRGKMQEAPNGTIIEFVPGWAWAMATDMIRVADIPDARLGHNGGDITIGEAVHQAGFSVGSWNNNKAYIFTPGKDQGGRRGFSSAFPWADPATQQRHIPGT